MESDDGRDGDQGRDAARGDSAGRDEAVAITDFILSRRVMGRKVEETMLSIAGGHARSLGLPRVTARYIPTERKRACLQFVLQSGFSREDSDTFTWRATEDYPAPDCVRVERRS